MEVVYSGTFKGLFKENSINCFYGDLLDLIDNGIPIIGIDYDDEWKVSKFFHYIRNKKRVDAIFSYLEIDKTVLNKKIKDLSSTDFKWVLISYIILHKKKYVIFDYFDTSLIYKDKKRFASILRKLVKDGLSVIIISKDLVFLNTLSDSINIFDGTKIHNINILEFISEHPNLIELPPITEFIGMANKLGANLNDTLDSKELLKDIYRGVK